MSVPLEVEPSLPRHAAIPLLFLASALLNVGLWFTLAARTAKLTACAQRTEALQDANMQQRIALERALSSVGQMTESVRRLERGGCGRLLLPAVPYPSRWDPESPDYRDPHGWYRDRLEILRHPLAAEARRP